MNRLFHISPIGDLKIIEPNISSHGKAWVYATECIPLGLAFGVKEHSDFHTMISGRGKDKKYTPYIVENYSGAFDLYKGKSCYIYEVDNTDFKENMTSWSEDFVSDKPVKVLNCQKIDDIFEELCKYQNAGEIILYNYDDVQNKEELKWLKLFLNEHNYRLCKIVCEREDEMKDRFEFCKDKFPQIMQEVMLKNDKNQKI